MDTNNAKAEPVTVECQNDDCLNEVAENLDFIPLCERPGFPINLPPRPQAN